MTKQAHGMYYLHGLICFIVRYIFYLSRMESCAIDQKSGDCQSGTAWRKQTKRDVSTWLP